MLKKTLQDARDKLFSGYEVRRLKTKPFIIITNNCWGFELYNSIGRAYNTPFVGLFLMPECYVQLLENFDECINADLTFTDASRYGNAVKHYPVGLLPHNIEIHFLHYSSRKEAREKWNRRISRLKADIEIGVELFLKLDCEGYTPEQITRFHALLFKNKVSIGLEKFDSDAHLHVPRMRQKLSGQIYDGAKLFKKRYRYFDITTWMLDGKISHSPMSRIFGLFP